MKLNPFHQELLKYCKNLKFIGVDKQITKNLIYIRYNIEKEFSLRSFGTALGLAVAPLFGGLAALEAIKLGIPEEIAIPSCLLLHPTLLYLGLFKPGYLVRGAQNTIYNPEYVNKIATEQRKVLSSKKEKHYTLSDNMYMQGLDELINTY